MKIDRIFKLTRLVISLFTICLHGHVMGIQISANVPSSQSELINYDLNTLHQLKLSPESASGKKLFSNTTNLQQWLLDRLKYIVSEKEFDLNLKKPKYKVVRQNFSYPSDGVIPYSIFDNFFNQKVYTILEMSSINQTRQLKPLVNMVTIMQNDGAVIYHTGKTAQMQLSVSIPLAGNINKEIVINSPRVGIISIGPGLFQFDVNKIGPKFESNSIHRLATFYHEARHSDGKAESLGFFHATCPEEHDYRQRPVCDKNVNGPYSIKAVFLKEAIDKCQTCDEKEKEALKLQMIDSQNRVLKSPQTRIPLEWDESPEFYRLEDDKK